LPKIKLNRPDIAKIASIAIIVVMLLSIQAPVFALTQGPAQVIYQTPSGTQVNTNTTNSLLPNVAGYTLSYVYRDTIFEQESGDDAALVYSYASPNDTTSTVWVAIQIAPSVTSEHRWETCLVNYPLSQGDTATVDQLDLRDIQIQSNPPITARYFAFQYKDTNETQVVLYWYETATFDTNGTAETKSVMISLVMYPPSTQNYTNIEAQELPFANAINNYWAPIQTWSTIALNLSQNGLALSATATTILALLILYALYLDRKEKLSLLNLYRKLPTQDQLLVKAVANAQKQRNPTTEGVAVELQKLTETIIDRAWLTEKLAEVEKVGLIKKALVNKEDQPRFAWASLLLQKRSFQDIVSRINSF
jgi:hypothetical protein